jgi:hypothetical protein
MISYLDIYFSGEPIVNYNIPDLFHLIGFAFIPLGLQVEDFSHTITTENVVASSDPLLKSQAFQQLNNPGKWDVRI